jgi:hypothetical protein
MRGQQLDGADGVALGLPRYFGQVYEGLISLINPGRLAGLGDWKLANAAACQSRTPRVVWIKYRRSGRGISSPF